MLRLGTRLFVAVCLAAGVVTPGVAQDGRGPWRQMTPEQRAQFWRSMPPDQRERMMQERQGRSDRGGAMPRDHHRQLSPEERVQLREQIREANRDWRQGAGKGGRGDRK